MYLYCKVLELHADGDSLRSIKMMTQHSRQLFMWKVLVEWICRHRLNYINMLSNILVGCPLHILRRLYSNCLIYLRTVLLAFPVIFAIYRIHLNYFLVLNTINYFLCNIMVYNVEQHRLCN